MPTWKPEPISRYDIHVRAQDVKLIVWEGKPGRISARRQYHYLRKGGQFDTFTSGGETIDKTRAYGMGQKFGQLRIVATPAECGCIFMDRYAVYLAEKWGLNEYGWYAAVHTDTAHPHIHFIAETEAQNGRKLTFDRPLLLQWKWHAQARATRILGPQKYA